MIDFERAVQVLDYDQLTGVFRWKHSTASRIKIGAIAGSKSVHVDGKQYWRIRIDGVLYFAHRLAVLITTGEMPIAEIDHVDGNGLNNRIENLRVVSHSMNQRNMRKPSHNTSGTVGVRWRKDCRRWRAVIHVDGKTISIGHFTSKEDAVRARKQAEKTFGFHANHGVSRPL